MSEDALSALQLLAAMYPMDGELELNDAASSALASIESGDQPALDPSNPLELVVRVPIDDDGDGDDPRRVDLVVTLTPTLHLMIRQPPFLSRASYQTLTAALPPPSSDASESVMAAIEAIRFTAPSLADDEERERQDRATRKADKDRGDEGEDDGPLERVWFWFPSLSTREKRKDLVTYAATYRLCGFVLSGKPALLCVEGGGRAVDRYMADIKSVSWGDIPSFQKKVSGGRARSVRSERRSLCGRGAA